MSNQKEPSVNQTTGTPRLAGHPYLGYHIAALAWIFFPRQSIGGNEIPRSLDDIPGIDLEELSPAARAGLTQVFTTLTANVASAATRNKVINARTAVLAALADMDNLWGGSDSELDPPMVVNIANI